MLDSDILRPSVSPFASPITLAQDSVFQRRNVGPYEQKHSVFAQTTEQWTSRHGSYLSQCLTSTLSLIKQGAASDFQGLNWVKGSDKCLFERIPRSSQRLWRLLTSTVATTCHLNEKRFPSWLQKIMKAAFTLIPNAFETFPLMILSYIQE